MSGLGAVLRRFTASDVIARFGEVVAIRTFLVDNLVSVLIDLVMLLTSALFLLLMSPTLAAIAVGFIPVQLVITYVAGRRVHAHSAAFLQRYDRYQSHLMDSLRGADVIQSHALELPFTQRMKRLFSPTLEHSYRANLASLWGVSLSQAVDVVASALVLWAAVGQVMAGSISIGAMLAFPLMQRQLSTPVLRLANQWRDLQRTRANLERLGGVLDLEQGARQRRDAVLDLPRVVGSIRFQRASLSERIGERTITILKRIELEIAPGEVVAIVGPSGSGKSSLARLILRMSDPTEGAVSIDGYNLRDVTPSSIREQVGYVTQDTQLFSGTVLENIACGRAVSNDAVIKSAMLAGAYDFIQGLPYGLHTQVGERGVPLSGGERQRIVIARALVTDPKILIFDEATAALDPLSERMIHESLRRITSGRTTLIISHRIQAIQHVDRTIVMNEGGVSQVGSHASLAAVDGKLYAALVGAVPTWQNGSQGPNA
jgi:ATP-binding cassette, subfamily B, bacterial HlyB/CyaB